MKVKTTATRPTRTTLKAARLEASRALLNAKDAEADARDADLCAGRGFTLLGAPVGSKSWSLAAREAFAVTRSALQAEDAAHNAYRLFKIRQNARALKGVRRAS